MSNGDDRGLSWKRSIIIRNGKVYVTNRDDRSITQIEWPTGKVIENTELPQQVR